MLKCLITNKKTKSKIGDDLFYCIEDIRDVQNSMDSMTIEGDTSIKSDKTKKELLKFSEKLLKQKTRREDLEYDFQKNTILMNQKWKIFNQEFFNGFSQFDIKDVMRMHLQLDSPKYFIKSDYDLNIWLDTKFTGNLELRQELENSEISTLDIISNGLSLNFMKEKIQEPSFSYEKMFLKKKEEKNK